MMSNSVAYIAGILLAAAVSHTSAQVEDYGPCNSPTGEQGTCIVLQECKFLFKMLEKKPLKDEDRQFLASSQCGFHNDQFLVCCPSHYIGTPDKRTDAGTQGLLPQPGACGKVMANRIYGGSEAQIDEFPWLAKIEYKNKTNYSSVGHKCGGSLISERYVLTAAHCIKALTETLTPSRVRLGEWDTTTDQDCEVDMRGNKDCADPHIDITIESITTHQNYASGSKNQLNDIALIRLSRTVTYTDFIRPICLPVKENLIRAAFDGIAMDVAGWGKTERGSESARKLKATVSVVPFSECQRMYGRRSIDLRNSQLCAGGERGVDSCRGDSGGPLIGLDNSNKRQVYNFLAGIVSFGPTPCGSQGWPGVYTKVSEYIDWIQQNMYS